MIMNLTTNSSPVELDTSTSATNNDVVESTQSDSTAENVQEETSKTSGPDTENTIVVSSTVNADIQDRNVVSSTMDDENDNREQSNKDTSSSFAVPRQVNNSTREKQLLERVFNLIKADQVQNKAEEKGGSLTLTNVEVTDEVSDSDEKQYKCDKCDMQFARHSSLVWHMQSHATASQSGRGRKTDHVDSSSLHQHLVRDSSLMEEAGPFICDFCDKVFPTAKGKRVHISHMHKFEAPVDPAPDDPDDESSTFACSSCNRVFVSSKALKVHVSHMHTRVETELPNENGMFACKVCHKEFETPRSRKVHVSHMHRSSAHFNSSVCVDAATVAATTVDDGPPFACHMCGKAFDSSKARKIHISHMHRQVEANESVIPVNESETNEYGMFACEFCKKEFESAKARKIHASHKHKNEVLAPNSSVSSIGEMSLLETSNGAQVAVACELCGKKFQSLKAKKIHVYHMHKPEPVTKYTSYSDTSSFISQTDGGDSYVCRKCQRKFVSLIALRVHITHMHTRVEPEPPNENGAFSCELCGKEFGTTRARSIHAAHTHHMQKRCSSGIGEGLSMDSTVEEGDIFHCGPCNRDFDSARALKIHLAHMHKADKEVATPTAIDEGPYFCEVCNKDFESVKAKKIHAARAHPAGREDGKAKSGYRRYRLEDFVPNEQQTFPCHLCDRTFSCKKGLSRHVGYHNIVTKQTTDKDDVNSTVDHANIDSTTFSLDDSTIIDDRMHSTPNDVPAESTSTVDAAMLANVSIRCPRCSKEFETQKAMKVHFSRMHAGMSEVLVENADQSQSKAENQDVKSTPVNGESAKPSPGEKAEINTLECNFCHVKFETVSSMHAHIMREHDTETLFTCIFCKKFFNSMGSFKSHVQGICGTARNFDGIYLFSCDECPKTFSHPKSLQRHWRCDHAHDVPEETDTEATDAPKDTVAAPSALVRDKFNCLSCPRTFANVKGLAGHMSAHSCPPKTKSVGEKSGAEPLYKCSYCQKGFHHHKSRAAHMKTHANPSPNSTLPQVEADHACLTTKVDGSTYQCPECPKMFSKTKALANHSRIHEFACKTCPKAFVSYKALIAHSRIHSHPIDSDTTPSETSAEIVNQASNVELADVTNRSHSQPAEVAETADVATGSKENVNVSGNEIVSEPPQNATNPPSAQPAPAAAATTTTLLKEYACLYCSRKFPNLKGITTHSRVHSKENGVTQVYKIRNTIVQARSNMDIVIPRERYKCAYCPKIFMNARAVAVHSRIHKVADDFITNITPSDAKALVAGADEGGRIKCWICHKIFENTRALSGHLKAHSHKGFKCAYCNKSYGSLKALAGHAKLHKVTPVHVEPQIHPASATTDESHTIEIDVGSEADNEFPCQFCDRTFPTHRGYARHMWLHTQGSNDGHEESVAPGDKKPFSCRICGMEFAAGRQLGGHMRHHSLAGHKVPDAFNSIHVDTDDLDVEQNEEDQFICDTCDEIFESREELSEHVRSHGDPLLTTDLTSDVEECVAVSADQTLPHGYVMCKLCNRLFSGEKSLTTHMFKKHKKRKGLNGYSPLKMSSSWSNSSWGDDTNTMIRKRAVSPATTIDLENEFMVDPIEVGVGSGSRKRMCRSYEPADARKGVASSTTGSRLAFGLRTNGEIYAQNQPNMAAQFREKTYECMYCEKHFKDKSRLMQHVRTHPESAEHTDQELQDYLNLQTREHFVVQNRQGNEERFIFEQHSTAEGYHCSECDETFVEKLQMLIHMSYHMDNKQRNCDNDSLLIKADSSLLAPFKCNFCSQRFINKKYRNLHLCKRHRSDILQCGICRKLFICKETLKQHYEQHSQQNHSSQVTRYQCEYCGMCFQSKVMLKRHTDMDCEMSDAAKTTDMDFDDCEIVDNLRIKQEPMGEEISLENRDFEDDDTENASRLSVTRSVYESFCVDERSYMEDEKVKIESGADIRSFVCDCCNKRFTSDSDMRTHENHPQKLLFCCGLCNLYFVEAKNAEAHSKIHIVEQENELHISD